MRNKLQGALRRLDHEGAEANRVFYVAAESGAGATTFVRDLAWSFATQGYPTLLANQVPFSPSGREVEAFIMRCLTVATDAGASENTRLYEAPWLIVFDRLQWEGREGEIATFAREIEAAGRRACIVVVTSIQLPLAIYAERRLEHLASLTHTVSEADALSLGQHLNRYLRRLGTARRDDEWRNFFHSSMVGPNQRFAAFWVVLSFWLQRQFDMTETVQGWLYRQFRDGVTDAVLRQAIIDIAAMSTERQPLPDALLPPSIDYLTRDKLVDLQSSFGALGIVRFRHEVQGFWALLHDQLGRFVLNGLFYDHSAREAAGFGEATHPEHLRLLALKRIASQSALAHSDLREVAETFATTIFKIDPSQGRVIFALYWRETLAALDAMPRAFRTTSRIFLHHAAVSRRRIAMSEEDFSISNDERAELLTRAAADIEAALEMTPRPGEEPDLNLLNSLAHAYHDLAKVETRRNAPADQIAELRAKAQEATRRAYRLNPDNSYVIETYAHDLLVCAGVDPTAAPGAAIEVLGLVYGAMQRETAKPRRYALARLADAALDILMSATGTERDAEPQTESEAIIAGLKALSAGVRRFEGMELKDYPRDHRLRAGELLAHPLLRDNAQAVRLRYLLACIDRPTDLALQLDLLETLEGGSGTFTPQMRLELAILLHQRDRHHEASKRFRELRALWSRGEHFVEVPERLRWLAKRDGSGPRQVAARIASGGTDGRHRARVGELQNEEVPLRPQEFGREQLRPSLELKGFISFGHNGPLLRPLIAGRLHDQPR